MIGTTLAHYRITAALGAGGMGEVWRAHDEKLGREVALKVLPEEFSTDPQRLDRFEREARAVASLNHPHIVTIYSVEEVGNIHFLTMELVDGRTLETLIPDGGFDLERFFDLATPLAEAISAAHEKSVIHRDLKPANVMVDGEGRVKVMDFGLAKLQDTTQASDSSELPTEALTGIGTIVGTVPYMSPEQVEGLIVDHRTDVFSLGVMLYEMATGERPFSGESSPALMSSILRDVPPSVIEVRRDLPRHLGRIITRCLEKDRRDRYQTARDVFNELRALKREASGESVASAVPRVVPVRRPAIASSGSRLQPGRDRTIAVAPFRASASDAALAALAEGLAEDITIGLARFPYLAIIDGAQLGVGEDSGTTAAGHGVRYILRGGLRSAGSELRLSVQLVEVETGAHVWSETYDRRLEGASIFELQDDLTDRVVATVGDYSGVMARLVAAELRALPDEALTVDDWIMRAVCFVQVIHPPEEHAAIRDGLERMVELHPDNAEAHAWLANTYINEFAFGFNALEDPIGRSLRAAQRAVDLDPTCQAGWLNLAGGHFFLGDLAAFEAAATRAMALNPRNSYAIAYMGLCFGNSGQRERGAELGTRACALNPHHPEWYPFVNFYLHYAREEYEDACLVVKGINWPKFPYTHINFAAACGQLGRLDEARASIETLRGTFGYDLEAVRKEFLKWGHTEDFVEHILDGLRKAGMDDGEGWTQSSEVKAPLQVQGARRQPSGEFDLKSIAVLPFVNMSDDRENEFFADGVTEEILTSLSKIRGLRVISRTSAMTYKGTSKSIREISAELEVGTVLEGSVRRAGDRVRVTAQLIEAATDRHLWSESYDRDLEDIFAVQGDVALKIAQALRTELGSGVVEQIRRRPTENVEAYDLYLKGRQGVRTLQAPEVLRGIEQLEEAITLDPNFAEAHGQLAISHVFSAYWGAARGRDDLVQARRAAERALALDPENVLARVARAGVLSLHDLDWEGAVAELKMAIEFDPNEIEAHFWHGVTLFLMGRYKESAAAHEVALALDPRSPNVISQFGLSLFFSGEQARGKRLLRDGIEQHPVFFDLPNFLAFVLKREGHFEEAGRWIARTSELTGHHPVFEAMHASMLRLAGSDGEARQILDRLRDSEDDPRIDPIVRAMIAVAERDIGSAVEHFNAAADQRLPLVFWFRPGLHEHEFPPGDPRVRALWQRLWPDSITLGTTARGDQRPARGNLPTPVDSFVAREGEMVELKERLGDARLVTLVGVGGTGKTRLAIETARHMAGEFEDGAWLVELAPVTKAEAVPHVVADLVGAVQQPGKTITESVIVSLRHRALLLVLDNCEHVLDAAAELAEAITTRCPGIRILATSRENLAIRGEQVLRLQSLADDHGAVLFRDRAEAVGIRGELDTDTLARLSRRLDGMPLAIELAAAHCSSMSPDEIEQRLDDRFRLLRGSRRGRMERQQTLRNTVAWSYDLLEPVERRVFDRLSAFAGGFTREAAVAVAGGDDVGSLEVEDAIESLVARSMVLASITGDGTRYRLLETLRQFGEEQLVASGDAAKIHDRHMRFFTDFMDRAWSGLWSDDDPSWIRAIGREYENLRVAVDAAIERENGEALTALLRPLLWWAWHALRYEVADWAEAALEVSPEPACVRAVASHLMMHGGRPDDSVRLVEASDGRADRGDAVAECLWALAGFNWSILTQSPDLMDRMHRWIEAGQRTGNAAHTAAIKSIEVVFRVRAGEMDEARRIGLEAYEEARATGNQAAQCWATFMLGRAYSDSDPRRALELFDQASEIAERVGLPLCGGFAATEAAVVVARLEEPGQARLRLARAIRSFINSGDRQQLWTSAHHFAYFLTRLGRLDEARRIWNELGGRQGWAAQHHRDELEELLGPHGESELSDDQLVERIRNILDSLEGAAA